MKPFRFLSFFASSVMLVGLSALTPAFATGALDLTKATATVGSWCTHTGINIACDRALQGLAVGGAAINTANPGDLQVDSSNVPRAPRQCKQGPAPTCPYGYQSGPSYDTSSCSWNYACIPQSPQPPSSVCANGFASGPSFNAASNSWSYSCNICTDVAQTPVACSSAAGTYGIPSNYTTGSASWTKNSCTGAITYTGGCSPSVNSPGSVTVPPQQPVLFVKTESRWVLGNIVENGRPIGTCTTPGVLLQQTMGPNASMVRVVCTTQPAS